MIQFDQEDHRYTLDGKSLISVTQLLQKYHLSPDYSAVDEETMRLAAERGTLIHKEIESYNKFGEIGFTAELANYASFVKQHGLKVVASEMIVHDETVAGTLDLLFLEKDGKRTIADIKTTSSLHKDSVSWQLSLYAYLYGEDHPDEKEITHGCAFWFAKDGSLQVTPIQLKPKSEVERLLKCAKDNAPTFKETTPVPLNEIAELADAEALIVKYDTLKKEAQKQSEAIKTAIIKAMEDNSVYTFENDRVKVTYVAPTKRKTIDSARLKKEMPEVADKFMKESEVGASLRITLKGEGK